MIRKREPVPVKVSAGVEEFREIWWRRSCGWHCVCVCDGCIDFNSFPWRIGDPLRIHGSIEIRGLYSTYRQPSQSFTVATCNDCVRMPHSLFSRVQKHTWFNSGGSRIIDSKISWTMLDSRYQKSHLPYQICVCTPNTCIRMPGRLVLTVSRTIPKVLNWSVSLTRLWPIRMKKVNGFRIINCIKKPRLLHKIDRLDDVWDIWVATKIE